MKTKIEELIKLEVEGSQLGLYTGIGGEILFHSLLSKLNQAESKVEIKLQNFVQRLEEEERPFFTFCSGLSGTLWFLNFLCKKDQLELDQTFFKNTDALALRYNGYFISKQNSDFMHGALGNLMMLADREDNYNVVASQLRQLLSLREDYEGFKILKFKLRSEEYAEESKNKEVSLGLSHGLPSVLAVLSKLYRKRIAPELCLECIQEQWAFLCAIENKQRDNENYSFYPSMILNDVEEQSYQARLAWCYGDLGLASALYVCGENIKNEAMKAKALEIFNVYQSFPNDSRARIVDAGICHGSAGVALIFYCMYWKTHEPKFLHSAEYWMEETIKLARFKDGLAGFKKFYPKEGYLNESNLLEGTTGIAAVLTTIHYRMNPDWAECFLLF